MSDANIGSKGWWQTLPGILTAAAGIITAITGLLVALGGLGIFRSHPNPSSSPAVAESHLPGGAAASEESPSVSPGGNSAAPARALPLPETTQVRSGTAVYRLLSLQSAPYSPGKMSLRFTIRMTNNGSTPSNFWSSSFRLRVNDSLQAPVNLLDDLVDSNSSRDGFVEFVIPADASTVGFQMGEVGNDKPAIPVHLGGGAGPASGTASPNEKQ